MEEKNLLKYFVFGRFNRYLTGGVINYGLKLGLTWLLTEFMHLYYFYSYVITLVVLTVFTYNYNKYITFKHKGNRFKRFIISLIIFMVVDSILVKLTTEVFMLHYLISIILITAFITIAKYFTYKEWVFK